MLLNMKSTCSYCRKKLVKVNWFTVRHIVRGETRLIRVTYIVTTNKETQFCNILTDSWYHRLIYTRSNSFNSRRRRVT